MRHRVYGLAGGMLAHLLASAAQAQDPTAQAAAVQDVPEAAVEIGDVIVTANKREQRLQNVPSSITALTQEDLRQRGATNLGDIIRATPGITDPGGTGEGNSGNPTIRNVTTSTTTALTQGTVSILFDDIPMDPSIAVSSVTNLRTVDINRVEVLRGPQGTLFGSGSLSGAIRYVTNRPNLTSRSLAGELTGAATQDGDESFWGHAVVNLPIIEDKVAIRAVAYQYAMGGYVDNLTTGEADFNTNRTVGGRVALLAEPTDRLSILASVFAQTSKDRGVASSDRIQPSGRESSDQAYTGDLVNVDRVESRTANLTLTYDLDFATLTSSTSYLYRNLDRAVTHSYYNDVLGATIGIPALFDQPAPLAIEVQQDIFMQELRLSSAGGQPLRWTLGAFYLNNDAQTLQTIESDAAETILGSGNIYTLTSDGQQREIAAFGEIGYRFGDFDVALGARAGKTELGYENSTSGFLVGANPNLPMLETSSLDQTTVTPRLTLSYMPHPNLTAYASASRGYRSGGPNIGASLAGPTAPQTYSADSLWNYEIGQKATLFDRRLTLNSAIYLIDWKDIQSPLIINGYNVTANAGAARIYGVELESVFRPTASLDLGLVLSRSHGETTEAVAGFPRPGRAPGLLEGERLPATPEVQAGGYATQHFSVAGLEAFGRLGVQYVGPAYTDFGSQGFRFGDYTLADFRLGVDTGAVSLTFFIDNLFDSDGKRSAARGLGLPGRVVLPESATRVRPRTIGLTLRASY